MKAGDDSTVFAIYPRNPNVDGATLLDANLYFVLRVLLPDKGDASFTGRKVSATGCKVWEC